MSKKVTEEVKEIQTTNYIHIFYCSECGKKIMESEEYDDGWYDRPDCIEKDICIRKDKYIYTSDYLCDECWFKKTNELVEKLLSIGFRKEER